MNPRFPSQPPTDPRRMQPHRPPSSRRPLTPRQRAARDKRIRRRRARQQAIIFGLCILLIVLLLALGIAVLVGRSRGGGEDDTGKESGSSAVSSMPMDSDEGGEPTSSSAADSESDPLVSESETDPPSTDRTTESTAPETNPPDVPASFEVPSVDFTVDLSDYERYMNPQGEDRDAYLLLVNADNPLSAEDTPKDLIKVAATRDDGRSAQKMREYAAKAIDALFLEAKALGHVNTSTGYEFGVTSAYRSYATQNYLFTTRTEDLMKSNPGMTREEAEATIAKATCRPGTSEHQTGLCCDMHNQRVASSKNPEAFADSPEGQWATENAWKFGFVLRFPADKTEITGITYESWHFRYVGRYHAYQMKMLDMCLEEYVEYLAQLE